MWARSTEGPDTMENVGKGEGGHMMILVVSGMATDVIINNRKTNIVTQLLLHHLPPF